MNDTYDSVLRRLREERERRNLTQRLLCYCMKIQQSHFSRAETGQRRFSYHELKQLCATDVDMLYIFTGKRTLRQGEFLQWPELSPDESICLLSTVYTLACFTWSADHGRTPFDEIRQQLEYIQCGNWRNGNRNNIFLYTRNRCGYTQEKMADALGVDIKKLRMLEKGRLLPDSELIWKMYDLFHVSPAFILKDPKGLLNELNYILDLVEDSDREIMLLILKNEYRLVHGTQ
ncbi:MAG: helix-turn-helix transcriptional regulator [Blautia sp.]|nr:helix-turn-helix transcriptional regulator [Blautia sp.]